MQHKTARWVRGVFGVGSLVAVAACATAEGDVAPASIAPASEAAQPAPPAKIADKAPPVYHPGEMPVGAVTDTPESAVNIQMERGFLNANDVNAVLEKYTPRLIECYERAGDARMYAAGEVRLRFLVAASGQVTDVLVVGNQLGSFPVERCLVVEGRKIPFPKPGGNHASDFEYNIEFRASKPHSVVDWRAEQFGKRLSGRVPALGRCGPPGKGPVAAVAYVKPGGKVVSVGFVSEKPIDTMAAKCVVDQIQTWRLPAERAHLVRTKFSITPGARVDAIAAPAPDSGGGGGPIGPTARRGRARRR
jgi:hypothetical protein